MDTAQVDGDYNKRKAGITHDAMCPHEMLISVTFLATERLEAEVYMSLQTKYLDFIET